MGAHKKKSSKINNKTQPDLGFGVGLRRPHFDEIFTHHEGVDFLEIVSENFMGFGGRERMVLEQALEHFPVIPHGVSMSIGSIDPLNEDYLASLMELVKFTNPPFFSDHLSYSSAFGVEYHDLIPLPFTKEAIEHVIPRIRRVQDMGGIPFLVENPSYYVKMPGAEMPEWQFVVEILEGADCGLLLDVNNVYVNSQNHGYDPYEYIRHIPPQRVYQYHVAGHFHGDDVIIDTHGSHPIDEVYKLYEFAVKHTGRMCAIVEWDNNIPPLSVLLQENDNTRKAAERALGKIAVSV